MGSSERFHVRWNEYESNIKHEFSALRENGDFFDVTLVCGSDTIKAHKVILSAFSPLLCSIIKSVPHEHPLVYLRGIKFQHLESLLYFMYNGEVSLTEDEFEDFLSTAFDLEIRGLIRRDTSRPNQEFSNSPGLNEDKEDIHLHPSSSLSPIDDSSRSLPLPSHFLSTQFSDSEDFIPEAASEQRTKKRRKKRGSSVDAQEKENFMHCDTELGLEEGSGVDPELEAIPGTSSEHDDDFDMDFEYYKQNKVTTEDCGAVCQICKKVIRQSYNLSRHFEAYHSNSKTVYECPKCRTRHRTKSGFQGHISKFHKLWKKQNVEMFSVPSS